MELERRLFAADDAAVRAYTQWAMGNMLDPDGQAELGRPSDLLLRQWRAEKLRGTMVADAEDSQVRLAFEQTRPAYGRKAKAQRVREADARAESELEARARADGITLSEERDLRDADLPALEARVRAQDALVSWADEKPQAVCKMQESNSLSSQRLARAYEALAKTTDRAFKASVAGNGAANAEAQRAQNAASKEMEAALAEAKALAGPAGGVLAGWRRRPRCRPTSSSAETRCTRRCRASRMPRRCRGCGSSRRRRRRRRARGRAWLEFLKKREVEAARTMTEEAEARARRHERAEHDRRQATLATREALEGAQADRARAEADLVPLGRLVRRRSGRTRRTRGRGRRAGGGQREAERGREGQDVPHGRGAFQKSSSGRPGPCCSRARWKRSVGR